jgi:hypothetical protein
VSISLFTLAENPHTEDQLICVASEAVFLHYWKPAAAVLKLRWISRFQTGWTLSLTDIPPIQNELSLLGRYLIETQSHIELTPHIVARISLLSRELTHLVNRSHLRAFIGPVGQPLLGRMESKPRSAGAPLKILWDSSTPSVLPDPTR